MKYHVVLFQYRMLQYREALFEKLREACRLKDIELHVVYGQATDIELKKKDTFDLAWGRKVVNRWVNIAGRDIVWQPFPSELQKVADLVIVMQENRLVQNYVLQLAWGKSRPKVAFWGHGRNYQSNSAGGFREQWKKFWINKVDWWFAYTEMSRRDVEAVNYDPSRITVLNNAMDGSGFERDLNSITAEEISSFKTELGMADDTKVMIHCGSLYADKRIDFMIQACDLLVTKIPGFHFIIVGAGPEADAVKFAAQSRPWLHYLGVKKGRDKALAFRVSTLVLNPGLVGLHVVDSFVAGCPMITLATSKHSPEIEYLQDGENGIIVKVDDFDVYANTVKELLLDSNRLKLMQSNCLESAKRYTLEAMVENFSHGMLAALQAPHR